MKQVIGLPLKVIIFVWILFVAVISMSFYVYSVYSFYGVSCESMITTSYKEFRRRKQSNIALNILLFNIH